jgi:hypothetical protein
MMSFCTGCRWNAREIDHAFGSCVQCVAPLPPWAPQAWRANVDAGKMAGCMVREESTEVAIEGWLRKHPEKMCSLILAPRRGGITAALDGAPMSHGHTTVASALAGVGILQTGGDR